jgi:hypothetical protein
MERHPPVAKRLHRAFPSLTSSIWRAASPLLQKSFSLAKYGTIAGADRFVDGATTTRPGLYLPGRTTVIILDAIRAAGVAVVTVPPAA